jgi:hypothetical protein
LNVFKRGLYRRILGPIYDNEKENWRILASKEIYARNKNPTITETINLNRLRWFGHVERVGESRVHKKALYMKLETNKAERSTKKEMAK